MTQTVPARILYVQHTADLYGSSRALLHLLGALDRTRYTPLVALAEPGPLAEHLRKLAIEPLIAPFMQTLWGQLVRSWRVLPFGLRLLPAALAMRGLIRAQQASLVHSNVWTILSGALGARLASVPHVWHVREVLPAMGGLKRGLARLSALSSRRIICISQATAAQFAGYAAAPQLRVVYDGLPIDTAQIKPVARPGAAAELLIGVVGRLHPQKGHADLLRAYALLAPQLRATSRVVFVGGEALGYAGYAGELAGLARALGVAERVMFSGFVEDVPPLLATFDMLVLPAARAEGLGGVLLEAMAAQLPVIATRAGGPAEVIDDGLSGLLVPPQQPGALVAALASLLSDPQLRERMGLAGRRAVEQRFSAARAAAQIEQIYQEIL